MKGFAKRAVLRLSAKELRTELYWAPPFTVCRATKGVLWRDNETCDRSLCI
jgi:hypothetical protein